MMFLSEEDRAMFASVEKLSKVPRKLALRGCLYAGCALLNILSFYGLMRYKYITRRQTIWGGSCPMTIRKIRKKIIVTIKKGN
jgi:hypothetical protein